MTSASDLNRLVSYAQNREDLYLWALVGHRARGVYVDVGCNSEYRDSVTRLFYERGWSGLNIDANEQFETEYARRRRDRFIHAGVGAGPGMLVFRDYLSDHGRSTFSAELQRQYESSGMDFVERVVPIKTLNEIFIEESIDRVDFLKIDVEGMEPEVLSGLDLFRVRPAVILVENGRVPECIEVLGDAYRLEFFDGLNTYFVDANASDASIYNFAATVLVGGYWTAREVALDEELRALRARIRDFDTSRVTPERTSSASSRHSARLGGLRGLARRVRGS